MKRENELCQKHVSTRCSRERDSQLISDDMGAERQRLSTTKQVSRTTITAWKRKDQGCNIDHFDWSYCFFYKCPVSSYYRLCCSLTTLRLASNSLPTSFHNTTWQSLLNENYYSFIQNRRDKGCEERGVSFGQGHKNSPKHILTRDPGVSVRHTFHKLWNMESCPTVLKETND